MHYVMVFENLPSIRTITASFRIANVVPNTITENTKVQIGSAISHEGCRRKKQTKEKFQNIDVHDCIVIASWP